jgi:hypothetical protein
MKKYQPTSETIEAFTCGDCWMLAKAIHDITGWTLVFYVPEIDEPWMWEHVAVRMPDGLILDIEGTHTEDFFISRWSDPSRRHRADIMEVHSFAVWEDAVWDQIPEYVSWSRARKVARRIVADHGLS